MKVFICEDQLETLLTAIYDAWEEALKLGHENVKLIKKADYEPTIFDEGVYVEADNEKAAKVTRSICKKISNYAYEMVYFALLSNEESALDDVYRFLIFGFKAGADAVRTYTNPYVQRLFEIKRRVGNEFASFREFVRFNKVTNGVYVSHIEPKSNVVLLVGNHFADRMPSENWMIIDDKRKIAVVHPKDEENYLRVLAEDEFLRLKETSKINDEYSSMWKVFFDTIAIKERTNYKCQRNLFPIWKRKNVLEFE